MCAVAEVVLAVVELRRVEASSTASSAVSCVVQLHHVPVVCWFSTQKGSRGVKSPSVQALQCKRGLVKRILTESVAW
jgi:hypothetical protein